MTKTQIQDIVVQTIPFIPSYLSCYYLSQGIIFESIVWSLIATIMFMWFGLVNKKHIYVVAQLPFIYLAIMGFINIFSK